MARRVRKLKLVAGACMVALLTLLAVIGDAVARPQAVDARVGEHPGKTRFVLELTEKLDYRLFTLSDPYRVVIDFPDMDWRVGAKKYGAGRRVDRPLSRWSLQAGHVPHRARPQQAGDGRQRLHAAAARRQAHRFVLDLKPTSATAFARQVRQSAGGHALASPSPREATAAAKRAGDAGRNKPRTDKRRIVAIDAGHGGIDPGAISISGTYEKHITLPFALELKKALDATGRYKTVLTRDRDVFLRLRERVEIARAAGAELFISIHADTIADKSIRGLSVYTLSKRASDRVAQSLAESENKADLIAGIDLSAESDEVTSILIDLAQRETMNLSARFASLVVEEARQHTPVLRRPQRSAGFAVLKAPDMPSALIELGFLSNPHDEKALKSKAHRAKIVKGIVGAIDRYFASEETWSRL